MTEKGENVVSVSVCQSNIMSSNVLVCPQPKDIKLTAIEDEKKQEIYTLQST